MNCKFALWGYFEGLVGRYINLSTHLYDPLCLVYFMRFPLVDGFGGILTGLELQLSRIWLPNRSFLENFFKQQTFRPVCRDARSRVSFGLSLKH